MGVESTALTFAGIMATGSSVTTIEIGLAAFAVVALAALLVLRARRDRDLRTRKAASEGYFDPDAARFGAGGVTTEFAAPVEIELVGRWLPRSRRQAGSRHPGETGDPSGARR